MKPWSKKVLLLAAACLTATAAASALQDDDVSAQWCLDSAAKEIYTVSPNGARETLVVSEAVVVEGEVIENTAIERMFDEGLVEAIDGADALPTSFAADTWETVIEAIYGHDAFGQRIEIIGEETANGAGDRCKMLKAPGFVTMFRAFSENFNS